MPRDFFHTVERIETTKKPHLDKVFFKRKKLMKIDWEKVQNKLDDIDSHVISKRLKYDPKTNSNITYDHRDYDMPCMFSAIFVKLLEKHGLGAKEFSELSNIPRMTVYQWTTGANCEDPRHRLKLKVIFNVDDDYLFWGKGICEEERKRLLKEAEEKALKAEQENWFLAEEAERQMSLFNEVVEENTKLKRKLDEYEQHAS